MAGYRAWQLLGRQVRAGSKAIWLFGYATRKGSADPQVDPTGTGPEPAADPAQDQPRTRGYFPWSRSSTSATPTARTSRTRERRTAGPRGHTCHSRRRIALAAADADPPQTARMLLHEAGHSVLHGPGSPYITPDQYAAGRRHRGVAEIQADGAAFAPADHLGLDTLAASTGYMAGWASTAAGSTDPQAMAAVVRTAAAAIHHAVRTIADGLAAAHRPRPELAG